jgi:uncharacterized DUF497 family protein
MSANIEFNPSAFKHGVSEADIQKAIERFIYEDPLQDYENKYLLLGFDTKGTLLEIMYNYIDADTINVFHAMPCRKGFYHYLRGKRWQE